MKRDWLRQHPTTGERLPRPLEVVPPTEVPEVAWHCTGASNRAGIEELGLELRRPVEHNWGDMRSDLWDQPAGVYVELSEADAAAGYWWRVPWDEGRTRQGISRLPEEQQELGGWDVWEVKLLGLPVARDPQIREALVVLAPVGVDRLWLAHAGRLPVSGFVGGLDADEIPF